MRKVFDGKSVFVTGFLTIYEYRSQKIGKGTERAILPKRVGKSKYWRTLWKAVLRRIGAVHLLLEDYALGPRAKPNPKRWLIFMIGNQSMHFGANA